MPLQVNCRPLPAKFVALSGLERCAIPEGEGHAWVRWLVAGLPGTLDALALSAPPIEAIYLTGGNSHSAAGLVESAAGLPVFTPESGVFGGLDGGVRYLMAIGQSGIVWDLGATNLKLDWFGYRHIFPRCPRRLPFPSKSDTAEFKQQQRLELRRWVSGCLREAADRHGQPSQIAHALCGVPCEVTPEGDLGNSLYPGLQGDHCFLSAIFDETKLQISEAVLVNDIMLAAWAALLDPRLINVDHILVISLGTAVCGARVDR
jgi:hypothetical protein